MARQHHHPFENLDEKTVAYLESVRDACGSVVGAGVTGLYVQGSGVSSDYDPSRSDLDLVMLVAEGLDAGSRERLARLLDHGSRPCPARGLDLIVARTEVAARPDPTPGYEFWFATGRSWRTEADSAGCAKELLLHFAVSRAHGLALSGPSPREAFGPVPRPWLLEALIEGLEWHRTVILHHFHDPGGQNAVLNACRACAYAEDGVLLSKTEGGVWYLDTEADDPVVRRALAARREATPSALGQTQVDGFLRSAIERLREARGTPARHG